VTGVGALDYLRKLEDELLKAGDRLKAGPFEVAHRVDKLIAEQKLRASSALRPVKVVR
jgi:hypothetical protein